LNKINPSDVWKKYQNGVSYNNSISLYDTVETNENFYIGKQWEGLNAPDLEKPVLNIFSRAIPYFNSQIISDDIGVDIKTYKETGLPFDIDKILSSEVEKVIEQSKAKTKNRDAIRNAAVDGDCCFYLRFNSTQETGQFAKGKIEIETVDNTNIIFGNPFIDEVQEQPYIIIVKRSKLSSVKAQAKKDGITDWEQIQADTDNNYYGENSVAENDLTTVLVYLWKDENGLVNYCKCTQNIMLSKVINTGYKLYPVAYMSWIKNKNSYHGVAAITSGVVQNQIYINTLWALFMIHQKTMAFPKIFYDSSKIDKWTNKVGQAIKVQGSPNEAVATGFRAPDFSSQAMELVEKTIAYTKEFMGITDAAMGNIRPDNTSAIIAVQKASAAPLELQKLSFYQFVEDYVRIILDIMRVNYGMRETRYEENGEDLTAIIDFSVLPYDAMELNVEVGAGSYWSEITQIRTADNLFANGIIKDAALYLDSIPDKYIKNKQKILDKLNEQAQQPQLMPTQTTQLAEQVIM